MSAMAMFSQPSRTLITSVFQSKDEPEGTEKARIGAQRKAMMSVMAMLRQLMGGKVRGFA
jgi:hypothetical protein